MARRRSQHLLTMAIIGPPTLIGVVYVYHLVKTGDVHGLKFSFLMELVGWCVVWCIIWCFLWISGRFKRYEEEEQPDEE